MSGRLKKRKHGAGGVKLDMAAMLDMAFQLLTFFILTFRPAPIEGEVLLRLPTAMPVTPGPEKPGGDPLISKADVGLETLTISAFAKPNGSLGQLSIGDTTVGGVAGLDRRLNEVLSDRVASFKQVVIQVDERLAYDGLMQVVDVCTRQKMASGEPLTKLSFVEMR
ncbi:ExbD/TolR family protein [Anatilimnocola floriformis]|uniref:ExbD/TolR family protein n=1 Tax=Anatilimnocola floriformis TaxID=2948575 RepID=UPI0020C57FA0|nr:biopolymer transporter ExbD [Anatilimnocola floriformis]